MRLYLSSFRLGNRPEAILPLLGENKRAAVVGEILAKATVKN